MLTSTWTNFQRAISLQVSRFALHENVLSFAAEQTGVSLRKVVFLDFKGYRPKADLSCQFERSKFVVTEAARDICLFSCFSSPNQKAGCLKQMFTT